MASTVVRIDLRTDGEEGILWRAPVPFMAGFGGDHNDLESQGPVSDPSSRKSEFVTSLDEIIASNKAVDGEAEASCKVQSAGKEDEGVFVRVD